MNTKRAVFAGIVFGLLIFTAILTALTDLALQPVFVSLILVYVIVESVATVVEFGKRIAAILLAVFGILPSLYGFWLILDGADPLGNVIVSLPLLVWVLLYAYIRKRRLLQRGDYIRRSNY